jgi:hypothetical protein
MDKIKYFEKMEVFFLNNIPNIFTRIGKNSKTPSPHRIPTRVEDLPSLIVADDPDPDGFVKEEEETTLVFSL